MDTTDGPLARQIALRERTREFALEAARLCETLSRTTTTARHVAGQLLRCSASVAANYRAACRSRSKKEFISKIGIEERNRAHIERNDLPNYDLVRLSQDRADVVISMEVER